MIGLHKAKRVLQKLRDQESGVHAVLLYGPEGAGKTQLANQLIEHWLGSERAVDAFRRGSNPDVQIIEPMGASRIIRRHQVTPPAPDGEPPALALTDFLRVAPLYSAHKVAIIHDADRMNDTATNALLKPLEEPASYAKLILTTRYISQIRQTILSRCLVVACELPHQNELTETFPDVSNEILAMGGFAPGAIAQINANPEFYAKVASFAKGLIKARPEQVLRLSDDMRSLGEELDQIAKCGARTANAKVTELVAARVSAIAPERADIIQALAEAHQRITGNAAANLVFDSTFTRIFVK